MMNFSDAESGNGGDFELIPAGTLLWAFVNVRAMETSKAGNEYLDIELTVAEGPYARRKLWDMIGIGGSEQYVNIGRSNIKAILESGNSAGPENPAGYQIQDYLNLNGLRVAVKTKIEKGGANPAGGFYADKVRPIYLSPNTTGGTSKAFGELAAVPTQAAAPAPQQTPPPAQTDAPVAAFWHAPAQNGQAWNCGGAAPAATAPAKPSWL